MGKNETHSFPHPRSNRYISHPPKEGLEAEGGWEHHPCLSQRQMSFGRLEPNSNVILKIASMAKEELRSNAYKRSANGRCSQAHMSEWIKRHDDLNGKPLGPFSNADAVGNHGASSHVIERALCHSTPKEERQNPSSCLGRVAHATWLMPLAPSSRVGWVGRKQKVTLLVWQVSFPPPSQPHGCCSEIHIDFVRACHAHG